jgi:hypothetical protein
MQMAKEEAKKAREEADFKNWRERLMKVEETQEQGVKQQDEVL